MTGNQWIRLSAALSLAAVLGCAKGEQSQTADSTARNLTLAPTESTAAMKDVPAPEEQPAAPAPEAQTEAQARPATRPHELHAPGRYRGCHEHRRLHHDAPRQSRVTRSKRPSARTSGMPRGT